MKLNKLKIVNFKGIKELDIVANGKNISVYGDNQTGKTSVVDAFFWLLFGKNSENKTKFSIKPLNSNGEPIHRIETSVLAEIEHEGKLISIKKTYVEKWSKPFGTEDNEEVLTGHNTICNIDGLNVKSKDYDNYIGKMIDENTFHIITDPMYFNNSMDWKQRRKIIMDICGNIKPEDVINKNKKLEELPAILNGEEPSFVIDKSKGESRRKE